MSGIDWSKAPYWATHFGPDTETHVAAWYRVDELGVRGFCADADPHKFQIECSYLDDFPKIAALQARTGGENLERKAAITAMRADTEQFFSLSDYSAALLYDLGYRKQVQP